MIPILTVNSGERRGTVIEPIQPMSGVSKYYWASVADFVGIGEAD